MYELTHIYDTAWPELTEKFYAEDRWPAAEEISDLVGGDPLFITLYRELYYRHIYGQLQPTLDDRFNSYENYCDLFNFIVHASDDDEEDPDLELPNRWLWDIIDEFIYQFESFAQYRVKVQGKTDQEFEQLAGNPQLWNVHIVLNVLHSLIQKSCINEQLEAFKRGDDPEEFAGDYGCKPLYKMLGYFSLAGLLRLHCLLGDYYQALRVMENIELNKPGLYSRVPACQVTIFYYVGFCYLMMGRYQDCVRTYSNVLYYIMRMQQSGHQKFAGYVVSKKRTQLFNLLAIAITISPQRIDESVQQSLLEICGDKMTKMQKGEIGLFQELFSYGCPKFVNPTTPDYSKLTEESLNEPYKLQCKIFVAELEQSLKLPLIRSYLKLYQTMPIEKLAAFCELTVEEFRIHLHQYKHKGNQKTWTDGTALDGERVPTVDVDFYLDNGMIHIADVKVARNFGQFFIASIHKMQQQKTGR